LILFWLTALIPPFAYPCGQVAPEQASSGQNPDQAADPIAHWEGLTVRHISFEGISTDRLASVKDRLPQSEGTPLLREDIAATLRELYASGLFERVEVAGQRDGKSEKKTKK